MVAISGIADKYDKIKNTIFLDTTLDYLATKIKLVESCQRLDFSFASKGTHTPHGAAYLTASFSGAPPKQTGRIPCKWCLEGKKKEFFHLADQCFFKYPEKNLQNNSQGSVKQSDGHSLAKMDVGSSWMLRGKASDTHLAIRSSSAPTPSPGCLVFCIDSGSTHDFAQDFEGLKDRQHLPTVTMATAMGGQQCQSIGSGRLGKCMPTVYVLPDFVAARLDQGIETHLKLDGTVHFEKPGTAGISSSLVATGHRHGNAFYLQVLYENSAVAAAIRSALPATVMPSPTGRHQYPAAFKNRTTPLFRNASVPIVETTSWGGHTVAFLFVDAFSGETTVYLAKHRSEFPEVLQRYNNEIVKPYGFKLKAFEFHRRLRMDQAVIRHSPKCLL